MSAGNNRQLKGLGLVSGGLDSLVSCLILKLQGIEVIGLNFKSPFCICDKAYSNAECGLNLFYEKLDIYVHHLQKGDDYLEVIKNPKYGYGKNLNPCIDCRIYILKALVYTSIKNSLNNKKLYYFAFYRRIENNILEE